MKISGVFEFYFFLSGDGLTVIGKYCPGMGHSTFLLLSGKEQEDNKEGSLRQILPQVGDIFSLSIPSGGVDGEVESVVSVETLKVSVHVRGAWEGKFGGLAGGLSCYGTFRLLFPTSNVESSWGMMPLAVYNAVRDLRDSELGREKIDEILKRVYKRQGWGHTRDGAEIVELK